MITHQPDPYRRHLDRPAPRRRSRSHDEPGSAPRPLRAQRRPPVRRRPDRGPASSTPSTSTASGTATGCSARSRPSGASSPRSSATTTAAATPCRGSSPTGRPAAWRPARPTPPATATPAAASPPPSCAPWRGGPPGSCRPATAERVEVERAERVHRRRVARLHARHAGEPGGLPAAGGAAAGDRLPAGPGRRAAVAGDRRLPRPGHRAVRGQGHRRDHPAAGRCTARSRPGDVVLADALFDNYFLACELRERGIELVARVQTERVGSRTVREPARRRHHPLAAAQQAARDDGGAVPPLPEEPADAPGDRRCPRQGQPRRAVQGRHHDPRRVDRRRADRRPVRAEVGRGGRHPLDQVDDADGRPAVQDARDGARRRSGPTCWRTTCSAR